MSQEDAERHNHEPLGLDVAAVRYRLDCVQKAIRGITRTFRHGPDIFRAMGKHGQGEIFQSFAKDFSVGNFARIMLPY
jgi:hypothetical protein